ncbi:hypothetical protein BDZ97DRAFT_1907638 [Flammula alnicola]|nr:hypothetical protein BDZ97DRAFT_1907638 [Flammula alnicola]
MSHFPTEPQRPAMPRRKSSAQNLLSSFKSSSSSSSSVPPPLNLAASSGINSTALSFSAAATPTATTPLPREWDAQSLHSDTVGSTLAGAQSPPLGQGTSVEYLRDLVQKRIITLTYIRNIHEGRSHWFHTILISRSEWTKTYRFAILGLDLLRGLLNTVTEYDQSKEEGDNKSKMRLKFKNKNAKKNASGIAEFTGSYTDASADASYLLNPSIPFPLDYHQTLLSLLDVLSEVYNKISKLLGPSPFPHSSQHMMGPLGLLSPHPGVSYLFRANKTRHKTRRPASLGDMVLKIDSKLKKITSALLKDLDTFARNGIKDELASLDPLLRNISMADDGALYDFEGM